MRTHLRPFRIQAHHDPMLGDVGQFVRKHLKFTWRAYRSCLPVKGDDWFLLAGKIVLLSTILFAAPSGAAFLGPIPGSILGVVPFFPFILDAACLGCRYSHLDQQFSLLLSESVQRSVGNVCEIALTILGVLALFRKLYPVYL